MKHFTSVVPVVASVAFAIGVSTASGQTRPDDRPIHGAGGVEIELLNDAGRPDDRANHGTGSVGLTPDTAFSTRPDDRANHGVGYIGELAAPIRPDDRAWRGAGAEPQVAVTQSVDGRLSFDWIDAGIGAGAAFGLAVLLAGGMVLVARRRVTALP